MLKGQTILLTVSTEAEAEFDILEFIIGEIPFVLLLLLLIYVLFIRPKRKYKRLTEDPDRFYQMGDEILMDDGALGLFVKYNEKSEKITIESGSTRTKLVYPRKNIAFNLSAEERVAETYKKKTLLQKIASKI